MYSKNQASNTSGINLTTKQKVSGAQRSAKNLPFDFTNN